MWPFRDDEVYSLCRCQGFFRFPADSIGWGLLSWEQYDSPWGSSNGWFDCKTAGEGNRVHICDEEMFSGSVIHIVMRKKLNNHECLQRSTTKVSLYLSTLQEWCLQNKCYHQRQGDIDTYVVIHILICVPSQVKWARMIEANIRWLGKVNVHCRDSPQK